MKIFNRYSVIFGLLAALLIATHYFFICFKNETYFDNFWRLLLTLFCVVLLGITLYQKASKKNIGIKRFLLFSGIYAFLFYFIFIIAISSIAFGKTSKVRTSEILAEGVKLVRDNKEIGSKLEIMQDQSKTIFYIFEDIVIGSDENYGVTVIVFKNKNENYGNERCLALPERYAPNVCRN